VVAVGRLEQIIARNRRPNQMRERLVVSLVFGGIILLILFLAVFTDLGAPPADPPPAPDPTHRVDGVMLRRQPVKPAPRP
jgi:hypothetical protein